MPFIRKLLSPKVHFEIFDNEIKVNCVNGYLIPNTTFCVCYPGWTSDDNGLDQCDIDTGENNTNTNSKEGIIYYKDDSNDGFTSATAIIFFIFLILLILGAVCALLLYLFKKYKDIKLVKQKIKFEKKRIKNLGTDSGVNGKEDNKEKDINGEKNNQDIEKVPDFLHQVYLYSNLLHLF